MDENNKILRMPLCQDNSDDIPKENQLADGAHTDNIEQMNLMNNGSSAEAGYKHIPDDNAQILNNITLTNSTSDATGEDDKHWLTLNELQMIKVIVLVVVVGILLLSTCKIVFKTFSRYSGKRPDHLWVMMVEYVGDTWQFISSDANLSTMNYTCGHSPNKKTTSINQWLVPTFSVGISIR